MSLNTITMSTIACANCGSCQVSSHSQYWNSSSGTLRFWCGACMRKCRVNGCTSCTPDKHHYCRHCNRHDVSHRSSNCWSNPANGGFARQQQQQQQLAFQQQQLALQQQQFTLQQQLASQLQIAPQQLIQNQATRSATRLVLGAVTPTGVAFRAMTPADVIAARGSGGGYVAPSLQSVVDAQRREDAQQNQNVNIRWAPTNFSPQGGFPF